VRFEILREAELEATEAACWYERQREGLGVRFQQQLDDCICAISEHPKRFSLCQHIDVPEEIRWARLKRFPYVVTFSIDSDSITIVAVSHGARRPGYWKDRLA
jgi:toxin ParE1/3/4